MTLRLRMLLRFPLLIFFLLTSLFGLLSYIPFAYLQFLRHQLFAWLAFFVLFHHVLYWAALLFGALSVADDLAAARRSAWIVVGMLGLYGVWLLFHPVLPTLANDHRSLIVGMASLAVPLAFAALDHLANRGPVAWNDLAPSAPSDLARAPQICGSTALYLWLTFSAIAVYRMYVGATGHLSAVEFVLAALWSLAVHLAAAAGLCVVFAGLTIVRSPRARYGLMLTCMAAAAAVVLVRIVFAPIAFRGVAAVMVAFIYGFSAAAVWSGFAHRHRGDGAATGNPRFGTRRAAMALVLLSLAGFAAVEMTAMMDWYFLQQKLIAFVIWVGGFLALSRIAGARRRFIATAAMAAALAIVAARLVAGGAPIASRLTLAVDRYAPYDASLMLLQGALSARSGRLAEVTSLLVDHSNVTHARPASIDFASPLPVSAPQPHIFVFVVDSLRRDYLSPYNPAVDFTPAIQAFADESLTFTRAFTRYSGTGLSEPAFWSGALLPHKEYVTPFAPMNALEKLLVAQKYRRLISVDLILRQLLTPSEDLYELDRGIQNRHYQLCGTLAQLRTLVPEVVHAGRSAFVFTQSQDTHLANVATDDDARSGVTTGPFYRPYATRLQRLDECFGEFIRYLKDAGVYDNSVIVLTSDHGDSLGEEGRWGHAYTVFPEVIQVPLIMHVPAALRGSALVDTDAVAFTTDITPTLYQLLGRPPAEHGPMYGAPLIGMTPAALTGRREQPYLVASSYGPVYGLLENNAASLYIIDAVNTAEHRYDLQRGLNGERTIITDAERARAIDAIRSQVLEVSRFYGVKPAR